MATIRTSLETAASPDDAWAAIRDVGALHTRLAPGFVADTKLEPGARVVTFAKAWSCASRSSRSTTRRAASSGPPRADARRITTHRCRFAGPDGGAVVVWTADFLPDDIKPQLAALIEAGTRAMKRSLDALAR